MCTGSTSLECKSHLHRKRHQFSGQIPRLRSLRDLHSDGMKEAYLPKVLEAHKVIRRKVRHEDPHRSRSSPTILLRNGGECKRERIASRAGAERGFGVAEVAGEVERGTTGGGRSEQLLAGVPAGGARPRGAGGDGASATGESDRVGQAEERPGGFGDPGAPVALRSATGGVDGR